MIKNILHPENKVDVIQKVHPDYDRKILSIIRSAASPKVLRDELLQFHASSIADALFDLEPFEREKLYKLLDTARLANIFEYLDEKEQVECLNEVHIRKAIALLNEMEPSAAASLLRLISKTKKDIIIELLEPERRRELNLIISYSDDLIGSDMTTDFIEISKDLSIADAMRQLRLQAKDNDNISIIYLKDASDQYYGVIRIADLFGARLNDNLEELAETNFPFVYATEPVESVLDDLKEYSEDSIPVLNNENRLLGIVTSQDLLKVFDRESGEDYMRFAAVSAEEDLEETLFESVKKRLPWLCLLLGLALGVSAVVSMFETVVVNGIILGLASGLICAFFIHYADGFEWMASFSIAGCISLSMIISMVISSFTGTGIPIFFQALHIDPAAASGPLITTLNDLIGVVTYYSLCWLILIQILHI